MQPIRHTLLSLSLCLQAAIGLAKAGASDSGPQYSQSAFDPRAEIPTASSFLTGPAHEDAGAAGSPGLGKQLLGGLAYGSGGMLVGGAVGAGVLGYACWQWGEDCGFAGLGGALLGGALGFAGAFPLGVYKFGTDENVSGSLKWTYASALLVAAVGFGGWALISGLEDEDAWFQSSLIGTAGLPIGALIGFNATKGMRQGVPAVSLSPRHGGGWGGQLTWRLGMAKSP